MSRLFAHHETVLAMVILMIVFIVAAINPNFFSLVNLLFLLKNMMVTLLFATGFFLILVIGGLDVSFAAVGVVAMYCALKITTAVDMDMGFIPVFLGATAIGALLGALNGILVTALKAPSLIVTLGTMSFYRGFLLFFVGTEYLRNLPKGVVEFSRSNLFKITASNGAAVGFHTSFIFVALIIFAVALLLRHTVIGRQAFAVGADAEAAARAGFRVRRIEICLYTIAGALAGIGGLLSATYIKVANPFSIIGTELDVIAAVVIGGAAITGGRGSVLGTVLGVVLIAVLRNSLTLLAIPSQWHQLSIGLVILVAIILAATRARANRSIP